MFSKLLVLGVAALTAVHAALTEGTYNIFAYGRAQLGAYHHAIASLDPRSLGPFEKWIVEKTDDGTFILKNKGLNSTVYVGGNGRIHAGDQAPAIPFAFEDRGRGYFIVTAPDGSVLTVDVFGEPASRARVAQQDCASPAAVLGIPSYQLIPSSRLNPAEKKTEWWLL
ncbi:hypothetical protein DFH08DRAFT_827391 [Mycena albidolilacea]|uniref:Uncharacterized protein n=1 Tax=Mycena albidolilacea TaxID=1033008 RepID=A0AAD6YY80_9AGAR|nr:hypothetical protein DFH08DRAFT_827391 [Mycena albidolilacea]